MCDERVNYGTNLLPDHAGEPLPAPLPMIASGKRFRETLPVASAPLPKGTSALPLPGASALPRSLKGSGKHKHPGASRSGGGR